MPTVCVALSEQASGIENVVFRVHRAIFDFVHDLLTLATPEGIVRVVSARMYDATGSVDVFLTADALPPLFGCESSEDFMTKVRAGKELDLHRDRFNARGVLRLEEGAQASSQPSLSQGVGQSNLKRYISAVELESAFR